MKKSILIVLTSILLSYPISLMGADFETPHEFKAGDTISAEMMNELFLEIKKVNKSPTYSFLKGTWSCDSYTEDINSSSYSAWSIGSFFSKLSNTSFNIIENTDNGDYYIETLEGSNPFNYREGDRINTLIQLVGDQIFLKQTYDSDSPRIGIYQIIRVSSTRINLNFSGGGTNSIYPNFLFCDKQNLAPNTPSSLTYVNLSSSITLTWTDNQTEAVTGYKVIRKTVVTDNFTTVSTITDNTTRTYEDTDVSDNGSYWYRVRAYNSNGDGTPSKVVKSEFP
jgi:hypothetical protein